MVNSAALVTIPQPEQLSVDTINSAMHAILPTQAQGRANYRSDFTDRLHRQFFHWLNPEWKINFLQASDVHGLVGQFDAFVIEMAEPCGEEIALADSVMHRLIEWERMGDVGMDLRIRYHASILKGYRVRRGEDYGTLTRRHKQGKALLIAEFKMLRKRIRTFQDQHRRNVDFSDLRPIIGAERGVFVLVAEEFKSLESYAQFGTGKPAMEEFLADLITPGTFVNGWMAWATNRSLVSLPNDLSEVR